MTANVDSEFSTIDNSPTLATPGDLISLLSQKVVVSRLRLKRLFPTSICTNRAWLRKDSPAGVFLLLGPTGTGKTKTVEAIAELLHGSEKKIVKIDCGEFQMEHEMAKLIGAPPGYLGHRETIPILTQERKKRGESTWGSAADEGGRRIGGERGVLLLTSD